MKDLDLGLELFRYNLIFILENQINILPSSIKELEKSPKTEASLHTNEIHDQKTRFLDLENLLDISEINKSAASSFVSDFSELGFSISQKENNRD